METLDIGRITTVTAFSEKSEENSSWMLQIISPNKFIAIADFLQIQLIFTNVSVTANCLLKMIFNLLKMVMGIKPKNQVYKVAPSN